MQLDLTQAVLAILVIAIGTAVQASLGFGLAMIAAPLLFLLNPAFIPGPMIATALILSLWVAWKDRHAIDPSHLKTAVYGRLIGTLPAVLLLGSISAVTFDIIFALLVLLAVGMSVVHSKLQPTPIAVFLATIASGFMGTLSGIGGPPLALVYQNAHGASLRANLSMLFVIGTVISLSALALIGRLGVEDLKLTVLLQAGVVLGVLCSGPIKTRVDRTAARPYLLALCFVSACGVLLRALLMLNSPAVQ